MVITELQRCYQSAVESPLGRSTVNFEKKVSAYRSVRVTYHCFASDNMHTWVKITRECNDGMEPRSVDISCYAHPFREGNSPIYQNKGTDKTPSAGVESLSHPKRWQNFSKRLSACPSPAIDSIKTILIVTGIPI